ncbi:hypothetical protein GQ53DRAFT_104198 [Thozetella sp. PMI_491]|nr:hypothetical protein GQ53DRAFT_104198 [Thozetella sp. PMI_491]
MKSELHHILERTKRPSSGSWPAKSRYCLVPDEVRGGRSMEQGQGRGVGPARRGWGEGKANRFKWTKLGGCKSLTNRRNSVTGTNEEGKGASEAHEEVGWPTFDPSFQPSQAFPGVPGCLRRPNPALARSVLDLHAYSIRCTHGQGGPASGGKLSSAYCPKRGLLAPVLPPSAPPLVNPRRPSLISGQSLTFWADREATSLSTARYWPRATLVPRYTRPRLPPAQHGLPSGPTGRRQRGLDHCVYALAFLGLKLGRVHSTEIALRS